MTIEEKLESIRQRAKNLHGAFLGTREDLEAIKDELAGAHADFDRARLHPHSEAKDVEALERRMRSLEEKKNKISQTCQDLSNRLRMAQSVAGRCEEFLNLNRPQMLHAAGDASYRGVDLSEVPQRSVGPQAQLDGWGGPLRAALQY